jgi:sporulation protein YlmC with PRC-barrel domain
MNKLTLVATVSSLALGVAPVLAQTDASQQANSKAGKQWTQTNKAPQRDTTMQTNRNEFKGQPVRSDKVIGTAVFDISGKQIGEVRDVVFDENMGNASRAILSINDYLGIANDQLTPVEWNKMSVKRQPDGTMKFVVTADKAQLQKEQNFSANKWPDFTNGWQGENTSGKKLVRMSQAKDAALFNQSSKQIGDIKDVMFDTENGKVAYAVVSFSDDYINKGDRLTMIPWVLVRQSKAATQGYVLNANKTQLENAAYFEPGSWPNVNDVAWNKKVYDHYGVTTYYWTGS